MNYKKNSKPDYLNMSTREILEDQFKRGGFFEDEESPEQLYEWQGDGCDDCAEYEGQQFTLDNAPNTHPNCKCQLVADVDGRAVSISAGDLQRQRFEARNNELFERLHNEIKKIEKEGYVTKRIDQPTNTGIIQSTLDGFRKNNPQLARYFPANIKNLTQEQIKQIYKVEFFDKYKIASINDPKLQVVLYDSIAQTLLLVGRKRH